MATTRDPPNRHGPSGVSHTLFTAHSAAMPRQAASGLVKRLCRTRRQEISASASTPSAALHLIDRTGHRLNGLTSPTSEPRPRGTTKGVQPTYRSQARIHACSKLAPRTRIGKRCVFINFCSLLVKDEHPHLASEVDIVQAGQRRRAAVHATGSLPPNCSLPSGYSPTRENETDRLLGTVGSDSKSYRRSENPIFAP